MGLYGWTHRTERKYRNGLRRPVRRRTVPKPQWFHFYQHGLIRDGSTTTSTTSAVWKSNSLKDGWNLATRRTQRRSPQWLWFLNLVLIHRFSTARAGKAQLRSKQTTGGSEMGHLFNFSPYLQTLYQIRLGRCIWSSTTHWGGQSSLRRFLLRVGWE